MGTITRRVRRSRAAIAVAVTVAATGGASVSLAAPAHAATTSYCTGATTYLGQTMPGYHGKRVPCVIPYGSRGPAVIVLQRFLNANAYSASVPAIAVDGSYGPSTKRKVEIYQRQWNAYPYAARRSIQNIRLTVDGSWGPRTSLVSQNQLPPGD